MCVFIKYMNTCFIYAQCSFNVIGMIWLTLITSSARLRTRLVFYRRNRTFELIANYLLKVKMLFTSHLTIPILSTL